MNAQRTGGFGSDDGLPELIPFTQQIHSVLTDTPLVAPLAWIKVKSVPPKHTSAPDQFSGLT
jgi:hypothetical protein